jgi:MOSC domain-containing protein YiiM
MATPRVISVNVGRPETRPGGRRFVRSAIWKAPVDGPVRVEGVNLEGDDQADRRVHGGPDKAVYAYAIEDTALWEDELGRSLGPATFGENLTTSGLDVCGAVVGERWRIGTVELEVCQPRLPCFKLGARMGDPRFVRRFAEASRPGAYLRIVTEGSLSAGDEIDVVSRPSHGVTMALMSEAILLDHSRLPEVLAASGALTDEWRGWIAERAVVETGFARRSSQART